MKCIIIEDENPAQEILNNYISQCPAIELIGIYSNALEAQSVLNSGRVDLIFLDINLPLVSGIDLLKSLKNPPHVIITTACPEYAIEGFNLDVTDYLLKPFSFARFLKATNKAFKQNQGAENNSEKSVSTENNSEYIILNIDKVLHKLNPNEIMFVSSDRDYVVFHSLKRKYVVVGALKKWEQQLPEKSFHRIHKSHLVNLNLVDQVNGNQVRIGEKLLPIGRTYKSQFMKKFGSPLKNHS